MPKIQPKAGDDKDEDEDVDKNDDDDDDDDAKGQDSVVWGEQKVYKKNLSFWQRTEVFLDDDDSYTNTNTNENTNTDTNINMIRNTNKKYKEIQNPNMKKR